MSAGRFLMKRHFPVAACGCLFANGKQDGLVEWGVHDRNGPVRVDLSIDAATPPFYPLLSTYVRQLIYRRAYIPIHVPVDRYTKKKRVNKQSHFEKKTKKLRYTTALPFPSFCLDAVSPFEVEADREISLLAKIFYYSLAKQHFNISGNRSRRLISFQCYIGKTGDTTHLFSLFG